MTAIKPREARVVIYQGDDIAQLSDLDDAVDRARDALERAEKTEKAGGAGVRLLGELPSTAAAAEALAKAQADRDAFAAEAEQRGVVVVLHALPRRRWRELTREHPARPDEPRDKSLGVNIDTLPDALLPVSVCRDPDCPSGHQPSTIEGDTGDFLESLSDYDYYDRLFITAFALNRGSAMADPTLRLLSTSSQTSSETSN